MILYNILLSVSPTVRIIKIIYPIYINIIFFCRVAYMILFKPLDAGTRKPHKRTENKKGTISLTKYTEKRLDKSYLIHKT